MEIKTTHQNEEIGSDEIKIEYILKFIIRNKKLISIFTSLGLLTSIVYSKISKRLWEGQFQIVMRNENTINNSLMEDSNIANILGVNNLTNAGSSIKTELEILKSPSILMPVFDFVKKKKADTKNSFDNFLFANWLKNNLDFNLIKGTSVMVLRYEDEDKEIIIPVLEKISKAYQDYSGRNRKRNISLASKYLSTQIKIYTDKSSESFKRAQEFAIKKDLIVNESPESIVNIEEVRVTAANKIRNIDAKIEKIEALKDDIENLQYIGSTIPLLNKTGIPSELVTIDNEIVERRSKYTDKDKAIKALLERKKILTKLLKDRAIGYLKADRLSTEALMESATRPESVLIKYRELIREASRDESTLINLENKLNIIKLDSARLEDPWELITKPTLIPNPINLVGKGFILSFTTASFLLSYAVSLLIERNKDFVYEKSKIEEILKTTLLDEINIYKSIFKNHDKDIIQKEFLSVNKKNPIKVILSNSLNEEESLKALNLIFTNPSHYQILGPLKDVNEEDKIIFIFKLSNTKIKELYSIKKRITLNNKNIYGIFNVE